MLVRATSCRYRLLMTVATGDPDPWNAQLRELLASEVPFEQTSTRRRAIAAIFLIFGLIAVGILILLVGSALGSGPGGGCGGG